MENQKEDQVTQNTPEVVEVNKAEFDELVRKAESSSQNYARLKKAEDEMKELKLKETGEPKSFDSESLERKIEERVSLRLAGYNPDELVEIESYAKGKGISLSEAAKSPFIQKAVDGLRSEKRSTESTPSPSSKIKVFNGQPVNKVLSEGTAAEKQAAWESIMKGGANNNE